MKNTTSIIFICCTAILLISCTKNSEDNSAASGLAGKWNLVSDSMRTTYLSTLYKDSVYIGKPGDYYNFISGDNLFIKEGSTINVAIYDTTNNQQIIISYLTKNGISFKNDSLKYTYYIISRTEHNLTLSFSPLTITEFGFFEIIDLKR